MSGVSPSERQQLADLLAPYLAGAQTVGLRHTRELLDKLAAPLNLYVDGMEAAHVLRRCGFEKDHSRQAGPSTYRRKAA